MSDVKTIKAMAKGVRLAPRKVSLVAGLVRGRSVADALVILQHTPKRAAKVVIKAIASAQANATITHGLIDKTLVISKLQVVAGPRLKRFNPAAMGRALPYQKRSSHIVVEVTGDVKPKKPSVKPAVKEKKESK